MPIPAGTRFGPYEIVSLIGVGGMGEVYRAKDTRLGRDVAIKVLPESFAADPDRRARFEREAQAVAALSHPNIVALYDTGSHDSQVYVVMELLSGQTLRARLQNGALPVRKAVDIAVQLARGLGAAHGKGIIHRDLKPENVFLLDDGQVKILDFGLARQFSPNQNDATRTIGTDPGSVMGTLGYMAPEQIRAQPIDARADVFSFGAVLYEMVSGHRAFQRDTAADTTTAILTHEPPELAVSRADVPPSLERIVRHCLEKNANERFQSARDVAFALEALSGTGVSVPTSAVPTVAAVPKRGWWPIATAAALVAGVVGGMLVERTRAVPAANIRFTQRTWDSEWITNARFMPDGQSVVFSSARTGSVPSLFVMRAGEVTPQMLAGPGTHLLAVSSTGEMAVLTGATNHWGHRVFAGTLSRMSATGGARALMDHITEADFSPDGATLAVIREDAGTWTLEYPAGKVLHKVTAGYLSDLRVAPDGEHIAFFEHQLAGDDRGDVRVVDKTGTTTVLSGDYWGEEGIAWSHDSRTVYYAAGGEGGQSSYQIFSVNITGRPAPVQALGGPVSVSIFDIAADGRMLLDIDSYRSVIRARLPGETAEREFPWLDFPLGGLLSVDGKHMAFNDLSQSAGADYSTAWRDTSGGPVVRLGKGWGMALSPNDRWLVASLPSSGAVWLYPTGPGEPISVPGLVMNDITTAASWLGDSTHLILCGSVGGKSSRCYRIAIDKPALNEPVTPEGTSRLLLAPDDKTMIARLSDGTWRRVTSPTTLGAAVEGFSADESPVAWTNDMRGLVFIDPLDMPMRVQRLDLATGARSLLASLTPPDASGVNRMTLSYWNDGRRAYVYNYTKEVTQLFTVTGVIR